MGLFKVEHNTLIINDVVFRFFTSKDRKIATCIEHIGYNVWNMNWWNLIAHNYDDELQFVYQIVDNVMYIYCYYPNESRRKIELAFMPIPIGNKVIDYRKSLQYVKSELKKVNPTCRSQTGFFVPLECIDTISQFIQVDKVDGFVEFIYDIEYLAKLEGSKLKNVRRDFNRFERDYPDVQLKPYKKEYMKDCLRLNQIWASEYHKRTTQYAKFQTAYEYYLEHMFNTDDSLAWILMVKNNIIGYMNIVKLFDGTGACINRVTDNRYTNSSNYMLIRVMRELLHTDYDYINDGYTADESGEHLEQFKQKYIIDDDWKLPVYKCKL